MEVKPVIDLVDNAEVAVIAKQLLRKYHDKAEVPVPYEILTALILQQSCNITSAFRNLDYEEKENINTQLQLRLSIGANGLKTQPEVHAATKFCPHPELWECIDGMATEVEVLEFLYSLVRMLKPKFILETGTYLGYGTLYLLKAKEANGFGSVLSCDVSQLCVDKAIKLLDANGVPSYGVVATRTGLSAIQDLKNNTIDFAFIDSDMKERANEVRALLPKLSQWGVIVVHDTNDTCPDARKMRTELINLQIEANLEAFWIPITPRGLTIFRKTGYNRANT